MLPPRAYTFLALNIIRFLSLVALILLFSSSIVVIVHDIESVNSFNSLKSSSSNNATLTDEAYIDSSTVPNQPAGAFWAVLNRLLIIFQTILLFISEIGLFSKLFERYFPVLGENFGTGALGVFQCLIGAAVLSHHVDTFSLVSAFFLFSIGCLNILTGLIFREKAKSTRALLSWRESAKSSKSVLPDLKGKGILPSYTGGGKSDGLSVWSGDVSSLGHKYSSSGDMKGHKRDWSSSDGHGAVVFGFGRQGEKAAAQKGYLLTRPIESTPPYYPRSVQKLSPEMRGSSLSGKTAVNPGPVHWGH